ncbi:hypothetical protein [Shinella kummerowiae]|uniref:hypothetical protein n=1 Tax=Shinella kummerowiae TaxID=417745 RepID=UPI0021B6650A|nr:hypothetical protein [Shinella kummerowiae]MCT7664523.1 hypothetical protein [Shinella kummerowiae]
MGTNIAIEFILRRNMNSPRPGMFRWLLILTFIACLFVAWWRRTGCLQVFAPEEAERARLRASLLDSTFSSCVNDGHGGGIERCVQHECTAVQYRVDRTDCEWLIAHVANCEREEAFAVSA